MVNLETTQMQSKATGRKRVYAENWNAEPEVYDDGRLRVEHQNYQVWCSGKLVKFPRTEFLIISRLAKANDRFVTAEELWRTAWARRKRFNPVSLHVYIYR